LAYRIVVRSRVRQQLSQGPPQLQGYIAGIVAFLRVDPSSASAAFTVIQTEDYRTILFAGGRGFLDYEVVEEEQAVVLLHVTWLGDD
jgi:hypothetical protein